MNSISLICLTNGCINQYPSTCYKAVYKHNLARSHSPIKTISQAHPFTSSQEVCLSLGQNDPPEHIVGASQTDGDFLRPPVGCSVMPIKLSITLCTCLSVCYHAYITLLHFVSYIDPVALEYKSTKHPRVGCARIVFEYFAIATALCLKPD